MSILTELGIGGTEVPAFFPAARRLEADDHHPRPGVVGAA
jgi:hypothetical protein